MKKIFVVALNALVGLATLVSVGAPVSAASSVVYDALPNPLPQSSPSQPFEAQATSEFGDRVSLGGSDRNLGTVTSTLVTWAKQSTYAADPLYANTSGWTHPVTVNVYAVDNGQPGALLATKTEAVLVPWRAEDDTTCPSSGQWRATDGNCYFGRAFNASFDLSNLNVTLPNEVIVTVAYNTADYGAHPLGVAGPYNSLNVAVPANQTATVGHDVSSDEVMWNATYLGRETGLRAETNSAPYGTVALKITASSKPTVVTNADQCKNNGWKTIVTKDGKGFANQGACVSHVVANPHAAFKR